MYALFLRVCGGDKMVNSGYMHGQVQGSYPDVLKFLQVYRLQVVPDQEESLTTLAP